MLRGKDLSALTLREPKAWRIIDQCLADRKDKQISAMVRLEAAFFVLKRLYPEKMRLEGSGEDGEIVLRVIKEVMNGDHLQAPRFAVPNIQ